jgi:hypothetical protein
MSNINSTNTKKKMNLTLLARLIADKEGKKSQARYPDIREILKIIYELDAAFLLEFGSDSFGPLQCLICKSDAIRRKQALKEIGKLRANKFKKYI